MPAIETTDVIDALWRDADLSDLPSSAQLAGKPWRDAVSGVIRSGGTGSIPYAPSVSPVNNAVPTFNGVGGLQGTPVTIDGSGNVNASGNVESSQWRLTTDGNGAVLRVIGGPGNFTIIDGSGSVALSKGSAGTTHIGGVALGGALQVTASGNVNVSGNVQGALFQFSTGEGIRPSANSGGTNGIGFWSGAFLRSAMYQSEWRFVNNQEIGFVSGTDVTVTSAVDAKFGRGGAGLLDSRADNGFRSRNLANNADAPISCGNITASGTATINSGGILGTFLVANGGRATLSIDGGPIFTARRGITGSDAAYYWASAGDLAGGTFAVGPNTSFAWSTSATTRSIGLQITPVANGVEINNGTPGTLRDLSLRNITASSNIASYGGVVQQAINSTANSAVTLDTISGLPGVWFTSVSGTRTLNNYALLGVSGQTIVNSSSGSSLNFRIANFEAMAISSGRRVLIGSTLPTDDGSSALQVNGNVNVNGSVLVRDSGSTRNGSISYFDAGGRLTFNRSDSTGQIGFIPDSARARIVTVGTANTLYLSSGSTVVVTGNEAGGQTIVDLNRRPSDDSTAVGGTVRCWTRTGQSENALEVLAPGGGSSVFSVAPSGNITTSETVSGSTVIATGSSGGFNTTSGALTNAYRINGGAVLSNLFPTLAINHGGTWSTVSVTGNLTASGTVTSNTYQIGPNHSVINDNNGNASLNAYGTKPLTWTQNVVRIEAGAQLRFLSPANAAFVGAIRGASYAVEGIGSIFQMAQHLERLQQPH